MANSSSAMQLLASIFGSKTIQSPALIYYYILNEDDFKTAAYFPKKLNCIITFQRTRLRLGRYIVGTGSIYRCVMTIYPWCLVCIVLDMDTFFKT